eukprot:TRINITY_DN444_c0_g1_i5.p1 TRINITY_DN444_c0_g1~~TRINITY_DN444_c0_g1_i5.p1  ORF type:complete len:492 (-),score=118.56 TRINITY_DN444_c0_g1_i5:404-1879(-)
MRNPKKAGQKKKKKAGRAGPVQPNDDVDMAGPSSSSRPPPAQQRPKVWRAGIDEIGDEEELQFDPSAYHCLHAFRLAWPCLSFDVLHDALGSKRTEFPHTMFLAAGTQADTSDGNVIAVIRLNNLSRMKQRRSTGMDDEESDSESSSSEEEDEAEEQAAATGAGSTRPVMKAHQVVHHGGVNRLRSMPQQAHICGTWSDSGHVQIWDLGSAVRTLGDDSSNGSGPAGSSGTRKGAAAPARQVPLQIFSGHKDEGFAIDWSPVTSARLLSGDCRGLIHLWEPVEGGRWAVGNRAFSGHSASVEDLQWSPTESEVFASCSADQTMAIWDTRQNSKPAIAVKAHEADVNVLSWNRLASCMLATGGDDGCFKIWDLRRIQDDDQGTIGTYKYHAGSPITSIEWSPHDSSLLALTSADHQLTFWDLSTERDLEEERQFEAELGQTQADAPEDLPQQLLFVHQGQSDMKELHWHTQIPGMVVSTARDGFNAFRPCNM